jgi:hypothetical protein
VLKPSRILDTDHSAREALISCGAVLDHLRVTMAAAGWQSQIDRFPNANSPNHLASIEFTPAEFVIERDRRLASAIGARRTDRLPFSAATEWQSIEAVWPAVPTGKPYTWSSSPTICNRASKRQPNRGFAPDVRHSLP